MSVTCPEHFPAVVIMKNVDDRSTMCFRCLEETIWRTARDLYQRTRELEWAKDAIESDEPLIWPPL